MPLGYLESTVVINTGVLGDTVGRFCFGCGGKTEGKDQVGKK
jgi:hypothetical protein